MFFSLRGRDRCEDEGGVFKGVLRDASAVLLQQQGVHPAGRLHIPHGPLRAAQEVSGRATSLRGGRETERTLSSAPVNTASAFILVSAYSYPRSAHIHLCIKKKKSLNVDFYVLLNAWLGNCASILVISLFCPVLFHPWSLRNQLFFFFLRFSFQTTSDWDYLCAESN